MKQVFILLMLILQTSNAQADFTCDKIDYAQLKDSTREELNKEYCRANRAAKLNEKLYGHAKDTFDQKLKLGIDTSSASRDMDERANAQISCVKVYESVSSMLAKKFKAKPPTC